MGVRFEKEFQVLRDVVGVMGLGRIVGITVSSVPLVEEGGGVGCCVA